MAGTDITLHPNQFPKLTSHNGVSLREDIAYTDAKGKESKSIRKRTEKTLTNLQDALKKVLEPEETVLLVARCRRGPSGLKEQFFMGPVYYHMHVDLVFTNRRLIHFSVASNGTWRRSLRSLRWEDLAEFKVSGWIVPQLQLKYRNGSKEAYWYLGRADGKRIKILLAALLPQLGGAGTPAQGMVSLCPQCLNPLQAAVYHCASCRLEFKDEKTMVRRSLLIPGGGYFYVGLTWLGVMDFIVELWLSFVFLIALLQALSIMPPAELEPGQAPNGPAEAWIVVAFIGLVLAVEKWATMHHCRPLIRQFIPAK
jgi:hypothetical protein